jgi:hypothetical protein
VYRRRAVNASGLSQAGLRVLKDPLSRESVKMSGDLKTIDFPHALHGSATVTTPLIALLDHCSCGSGIDLGRVQRGMPEKLLNLLERHTVFEKRGGNGVPQNMR